MYMRVVHHQGKIGAWGQPKIAQDFFSSIHGVAIGPDDWQVLMPVKRDLQASLKADNRCDAATVLKEELFELSGNPLYRMTLDQAKLEEPKMRLPMSGRHRPV